MSIEIRLPAINGEIEAGITVGVDASLPQEKKLPIIYTANAPSTHSLIKKHALLWALKQFTDVTARSLFCNGIIGILDVGLICTSGIGQGAVPDGDWYKTINPIPITPEMADLAHNICNQDAMLRAVTVAIATKANFWLMNHHIGQGGVAGYVKKVLGVFFPNAVTDQVVTATHSLGRFTSTLRVLDIAGIAGLKAAQAVTSVPGASVKLSDDSKLRFQSMPAGTDQLAIAYEAAKRLVRSIYAAYCPNVEDFAALPPLRAAVMEYPASYHISASYLTGQARVDYSDMTMNTYLGRLGTFIMVLYKQSTLVKSPHMVATRVESYEDYDADFKATLARIQTIQSAARGRLVEEQVARLAQMPEEALLGLRQAFRPVVHE